MTSAADGQLEMFATVPAGVPTHIVTDAGAKKVMCGADKEVPYVGRVHVAAHVAGRGMVVCSGCAAAISAGNE